jgi:hypothetical protein
MYVTELCMCLYVNNVCDFRIGGNLKLWFSRSISSSSSAKTAAEVLRIISNESSVAVQQPHLMTV